MSTRVYGWEDNPSTASFRFKLSNERAAELVKSGRVFEVTLPDGRKALQYYAPPREHSQIFSDFLSVWRKKLSGYVPVWQMRTSRKPIAA
jgi:hypothetical protein